MTFTCAAITARDRKLRHGPNRSSDFTLARPFHCPTLDLREFLPYVARPGQQALVFTDTRYGDISDAPFMYNAQFDQASCTATARVADLLAGPLAGVSVQPVFIFSIGRCGSTLLANLSKAARIPTYSECDALHDLASPGEAAPAQAGIDRVTAVVRALSLAVQDPVIAIKMRSSSNADVAYFMAAFPEARFVFISRELGSWAASGINSFDWGPKRLLQRVIAGAEAHRQLQAAGKLSAFVRYEDLVTDTAGCMAAIFGDRGAACTPERLAEVMGSDSQNNTLGRDKKPQQKIRRRTRTLRKLMAECPEQALLTESPVIYG